MLGRDARGLFLLNSFMGGAAGSPGYYASLTDVHTKFLTNLGPYPMLLDVTANDLKTIANGGKVANVGVNNIWISTTSTGATKVAYEVIDYSASTGRFRAWVLHPGPSASSDTLYGYLRLGDPSVTTDQSNKHGVWDADFLSVVHGGVNGGSPDLTDSTSNANNPSAVGGGSPTNTAGQIACGIPMSSTYGLSGPTTPANVSSGWTWSCWFQANAVPSASFWSAIFNLGDHDDTSGFWWDSAGGSGFFRNIYQRNSGGSYFEAQLPTIGAGAWNYLSGAWNGTNSLTVIMNDGGSGYSVNTNPTSIYIPNRTLDKIIWGGAAWTGWLEELRVTTGASRGSAGWPIADYRIQSNASAATTLGTVTAI